MPLAVFIEFTLKVYVDRGAFLYSLGVELLCPGGLETQGLSLRGLDAQSVQSHVSYLSGYGSNS